MAKRYFEYKDAKSKKFWEVSVSGKKVNIRYGKIGTDGQTSLKELGTPAEAKAHAEKQAAGKVKKGYKEAKVKAVKKAAKKKVVKKKAVKKKAKVKAKKKKPKWYEEGSVEDKVEWAEEWSPEDTSLDINWLAEDVERDVREAIARNPNTPKAILDKLPDNEKP